MYAASHVMWKGPHLGRHHCCLPIMLSLSLFLSLIFCYELKSMPFLILECSIRSFTLTLRGELLPKIPIASPLPSTAI